ncbi:hypothetical protein COCC4DRAFT_73539 [Bipolaris maydis ATCC 48331]|uniref:Glucose-methanol-choline oxidoreductase N-terminal domain-containing protein n=2 Tax=Cochliobolus heterostrophus TaxID=5016 RepID=M2UIM0_COCH5|nr:uncharacterized protein COCC4DRAFT_73539 [Bipolaris maydis ATCC 48331]EMD87777.1 hypothetical protein COCHEDRAFT_1182683 [Bipolaris maydis C5]KAJ5024076.1 hypothetical protein J3E73DRAFT_236008 [Bipolaris maydis]ENI03290.1 hypothetical protein COCC4DRAFT_73539 [Bipolaris maydis ATCC 48331]KAJ5032155.1 hypothetical protein J3E74DRAFT_285267 [Bipolaris maydis]KAJ5057466.1 hypothetical protein J3E74DRAFT_8417 [Bipolaris maydis]
MFPRATVAVVALLGAATAWPSQHDQLHKRAEKYDYVIVGGGVSGLVVANRLSEDKKKTVLVIEAGRADDNPDIRLPYAATYAGNNSLFWNIPAEPDPFLANLTYKGLAAKVLGGGSIVNGMMYDRAAAADYDAWEALGNKNWGWNGIYPYFKKGTKFIPPPPETIKEFGITWDPEAYGDGPLKLGISDFQFPDINEYFKAFKGAGAHMPVDGNNGEGYGASWWPNTMNPEVGERSHARNSYYDPVSDRPNLKVLLETTVDELVFYDSQKLEVKGVKITNSKTKTSTIVHAKKEVILAAGALGTPRLLQLSGIGPRSVLEAAGIQVKLEHDGVGTNFQDHPYMGLAFNLSNMSTPNPTSWSDPKFNASAWEEYRANRTGPLTQARGNALAFIPLPEVDPERYQSLASQLKSQEDCSHLPSIYKNSKKLLKGVRAQREVLAGLYQNDKAAIAEYAVPAAGFFELIALEKPASRGTVMIDPANPQGPARVFYNTLSNPLDKALLASSIRYIRRVFARPELKRFSLVETSPGAKYTTDDEIINVLVKTGAISPSLAHPSCSCPMMPEDMGGCVSDELSFYGVKHLSIVDASIMPLIPSQHLQATVYAVAEKAADIIKNRG